MYFNRKSIYVAGGSLSNPPSSMTYVIMVIHDSVYLVFLIVDLNDLDILEGDIQNADLNAPKKEKLLFYAGD